MEKRWIKTIFIGSVCMLLVSCSFFAGQLGQPASSPTMQGSPAPAASAPGPSPTPPPGKPSSPAATPSPSPSPSPKPDPWAGLFTQQGAFLDVPDPDKGPWIYKDETLSIRIDLKSDGSRKYCLAEIYTRGPLPFGGLAYDDMTGRKKALPYLIDRQYKAVMGITADTVTWPGNPKGVMIRDGKVFYDKNQAPTLAVMPDGNLKAYAPGTIRAQQLLNMGVQNSFAFGPILVNNGQIDHTVYTNRLRLSNWRAAIGQVEKNHYICIVTIGGFTLSELAKLFVDNHCTIAYNLDGGHSASMVFMGEQLYREGKSLDNLPQRPLTDILLIGTNQDVPATNAPVYCNGVIKNPKNRPSPTDGPII